MNKILILFSALAFFIGMIVGHLGVIASPDPGYPNPGHPASEIGPGTFYGASSDVWGFPGSVSVGGTIFTGDQSSTDNYVIVADRLTVQGSDFTLGTNDGRSIGSKTGQRALVHNTGDVLIINFNGDFEGGTKIDSKLDVNGDIISRGAIYGDDYLTLMPADTSHYVQVGYGGTPRDLHVWGNLDVNGYVKIGGAKLIYVSGTNPSCPAGYQFLSKHYYGTCGGDANCPGCSVSKWDTNPPSCQWFSWASASGQCLISNWCSVSDWNAALCIGS